MKPEQSVTRYTALVIGAGGVIGRNLIDYLMTLPEWNVIGVSRRGGEDAPGLRYISADLLNEADTQDKLSHLTTVTHIFYAAYQDRPTWAELVQPNLAMLVNVVNTIEPIAPNLQHISLMQGYKVYGAHLGPFKTPAKETDAYHMPLNSMSISNSFSRIDNPEAAGPGQPCALLLYVDLPWVIQ